MLAESEEVSPSSLTIGCDIEIDDAIALAHHRDRAGCRQQTGLSTAETGNRHLSCTILDGHQGSEVALGLVADKAGIRLAGTETDWLPGIKEGDMHGVAFQAVGIGRSQRIAPDAIRTEDQGIVFGDADDGRGRTLCGYISDIGKTLSILMVALGALCFMEHLDAVVMIPVASDDYFAAVEFEGRCPGTFTLQDAEATETMRLRVVKFCIKGLSDA